MNIVHLAASPFFGGPERQMLGLALALPDQYRSVFLSYPERGLCRPFLDEVRRHGFEGVELRHNTPHVQAAAAELIHYLRDFHADVLCCHGYKPDLIGLLAARRLGIPIVAVSRGWTGVSLKVQFYDWLDRLSLHGMDRVVCVSHGQAAKVRRIGVSRQRIRVIPNAIQLDRFAKADPLVRRELERLFPTPPRWLVGAAGRLSPEKGFGVLVNAAAGLVKRRPDVGFVLFGDGFLRDELVRQIAELGLEGHFVLPGFSSDLDRALPCFDVVALPSFTEGMPNIVLEALAARVPVVATAVGGTPEIVEDGKCGYLVPAGDAEALVEKMDLALTASRREELGGQGQVRVSERFTFDAQSVRYQRLFRELAQERKGRRAKKRSFSGLS